MPVRFVIDEVVPTLMDTIILCKGLSGPIQVDEVEREVRDAHIEMHDSTVQERLAELERSGHVRKQGNAYAITDDGRKDIQKALPWLREVAQRVGQVAPGMR